MRGQHHAQMVAPSSSLKITLAVIIEEDDGGYYARVPAFKGLHVGGRTKDETKQNVEDAVFLHIKSLIMHGDPLPIGSGLAVETEASQPELPGGAILRDMTLPIPCQFQEAL